MAWGLCGIPWDFILDGDGLKEYRFVAGIWSHLKMESTAAMSREYPDRPVVGVGVVIVDGDRVLLIKRGTPPRVGQWSLPGGGQELGETHAETARREALEETGLVVEVLGTVDVVDSITRNDDGRVRFHYTLIDVLARPTGGTLQAGGDAMEACWFAFDDALSMVSWSETQRILRLGREMAEALEVSG